MCEKTHVMMPDTLVADTKEGKVTDSTGRNSQKLACYSIHDVRFPLG